MSESKTILELVKAQSTSWAKIEGKTRSMLKDLAQQFNEVHHADVKRFDEMAGAINALAEQQNKNSFILDALIDCTLNPTLLGDSGLAVTKRARFDLICAAKEKEQAGKK